MKKLFVCFAVFAAMVCTIGCNRLEWSDNIIDGDWFEAQKYCGNLDEKGKSDWRLPDIDELRTIVSGCSATEEYGYCKISEKEGKLSKKDSTADCNGCNDANGEWHGIFLTPLSNYFWSSSETSDDQFSAFGVSYQRGAVYSEFKHKKKAIRCVRGKKENNNVKKEVVKEDSNGLKWSARFHQSSKLSAEKYCASISYAGLSGWRLPTPDELEQNRLGDTGCLINSTTKMSCFSDEAGDDKKYFRCVNGKVFNPEDKENGLKFSSPKEMNFDCKKLQENGITWRNSTDYEDKLFKSTIFKWKDNKRCVNGKALFYTDHKNGFVWSSKSPKKMKWEDAKKWCKNLDEGDFNDWRLPNVDEARTLIKNCPKTEPSGSCKASEKRGCLSENCFESCSCTMKIEDNYNILTTYYSKLDDEFMWTSSSGEENHVIHLGFQWGSVSNEYYDGWIYYEARCVRDLNHGTSPKNLTQAASQSETSAKKESSETTKIGNLLWSSNASDKMKWNSAVKYCKNLNEGGYSNWRLPNIDELRTLIQNCSGTESGGACRASEKNDCLSSECWTSEDCTSCAGDSSKKYSKLGDTDWYWSSSTFSDNTESAFGVNFDNGIVGKQLRKTHYYKVRCVK